MTYLFLKYGEKLKVAKMVKNLGVLFSFNRRTRAMIDKQVAKANRSIHQFIKDTYTNQNLLMLYSTYMEPIYFYAGVATILQE